MSPISSVQAEDFDNQLVRDAVILSLSVEGLGDITEYAVRITIPAFDDNLRAIAGIVHSVHAAAFALNWGTEGKPDG